jgi:putative nucleotidyltransferase with HDIG domain
MVERKEGPTVPRATLVALLFLSLVLLLGSNLSVGEPVLRVGEPVPVDIVSPRRAVNDPLWSALKAAAMRRVAPVYVADPGAVAAMQGDVAGVFAQVRSAEKTLAGDLNTNDQVAVWQQTVSVPLPAADVHVLLGASASVLADLEADADAAIRRVLSQQSFTQQQLDAERQDLVDAVYAMMLPERAQSDFLTALLRQVARPNMVYSASATDAARARAAAAVPAPVIEPGQVIVPKGSRLTADDLRLLEELGLARGQNSAGTVAAAAVTAALFLVALYAWLRRDEPELLREDRKLLAAGVAILVTILLARLTVVLSPFLIPLGFASLTLGLLVSPRLGTFAGVLLGLVLTFSLNLDADAAVTLIAGSVAGGLVVGRLKERNDLLLVPLVVAGASVLVLVATDLAGAPYGGSGDLWTNLVWAAVGGILSGVLALGVLPFFEHALGLLSPSRLLELSSPNQPLLRRLLLEAPGTYHHSLIVANLAAAAADAIGADALLARVGAYYHDVGKVKRPAFFIENQFDGENPHDRISPSLSTLIITSHVKDGLEFARAAHLPEEIQAFIAQHHGTCLLAYNYQRAKAQLGEGAVREEDFRYDGPKPKTREVALVMLADGVEAATRAMKGRTPGKIEGLVRRLLRERLLDGQLDESGLTLKDLDAVARAFVHVLAGAYHARIDYPDPAEMAGRKARSEALGGDGQPADKGAVAP